MTAAAIADILTAIPQMLVMGLFIGRFIHAASVKRFIAVFTAATLLAYGALYFSSSLQTIAVWAALIAVPMFFSRIPKLKAVLYLVISALIMNLFSLPGNLLLSRLYPGCRVTADFPVSAILSFRVLLFPLLILSWFLSSRLCERLLHVGQDRSLTRYLPFLLVETAAIVLIQLNSIFQNQNMTLILLSGYGVFAAMVLINLLLARTINQLNRAHSVALELRQAQDLLRSQSETYSMFQSQLLALHAIRHDTANQLETISYLLETGDYAGAQKQLAAFRQTSSAPASRHYTGNTTIDAVISIKLAGLDASRICFQCEGSIPTDMDFDPAALCSVISNLLDNAIHACEALQSADSAVISLKVGIRQNYLILRCTNSCAPDAALPEPGSACPDAGSAHGWGLQILREIAAYYNGSANFRLENGQFISEIQLGLHKPMQAGAAEGSQSLQYVSLTSEANNHV